MRAWCIVFLTLFLLLLHRPSPSRWRMSHARVLVPIANGTEEIEAVTIIDTLRRAEIEVLVASVHEEQLLIDGSRHIRIMADASIHEVEHSGQTFDAIVLPGGMPGATNLRDSQPLRRLLRRQVQSGGWLAAICASPVVVLGSLPAAAVLQADHHSATVPIVDDLAHSYIASHLATAFPSFATKLPRQSAVRAHPLSVPHHATFPRSSMTLTHSRSLAGWLTGGPTRRGRWPPHHQPWSRHDARVRSCIDRALGISSQGRCRVSPDAALHAGVGLRARSTSSLLTLSLLILLQTNERLTTAPPSSSAVIVSTSLSLSLLLDTDAVNVLGKGGARRMAAHEALHDQVGVAGELGGAGTRADAVRLLQRLLHHLLEHKVRGPAIEAPSADPEAWRARDPDGVGLCTQLE